jgi:tetratricopeptide (TPR) repeat protein
MLKRKLNPDIINIDQIFTYKALKEKFPDLETYPFVSDRKEDRINLCLKSVRMFIKLEEYDKAEKYLEMLNTIDKDNNDIYVQYISLYNKKKDYHNLIKIYNIIIVRFPLDLNLKYSLGMSYLSVKDATNAEIQFGKILEFDPTSIKAKTGLIEVYRYTKDIFKLKQLYEDIDKKLYMPNINYIDKMISEIKILYFDLFNEDLKFESYEDILFVEKKYNDKIKAEEYNIKVLFSYAVYLYKFNNIKDVIKSYNKILSIDNLNIEARYYLIKIYNKQNDKLNMERLCLEVLNINQNDFYANYNLALLNYNNDNIKDALLICNKLAIFYPLNTNIYMLYTKIYVKLNDIYNVELNLKRILEIEPNNVNVHSHYGDLLVKQKKFDEAIVAYNKVLEIVPLNTEVLIKLDNLVKP